MDIDSAFDAMRWEVLAETTDRLPIAYYLKCTLNNYISHKKIGSLFSDAILWFTLFCGFPQGSHIGHLLWTILADRLIKVYKNIISYTDYFVVLQGVDTRLVWSLI